jgi:FKBP-type peptidyl-prolyl cis-trans isomerase SlyD
LIQYAGAAVAASVVMAGMVAMAGDRTPQDSALTVKDGAQVSLEYTLKLEDMTVLESNVGKEPVTYHQGAHEIVPGLERSLEGLSKGDKKHITVKPAEGYGEIDPGAVQEVKKTLIPEAAQKVGAQLEAKSRDGHSTFPRVKEVKNDTVVLDFNHPLAGKTLVFDVTVLDVKPGAKP